ncbi:MAG: hypothetical protein Kow0074_02190 [Candidatus Zixiibacteriota bacterium]
MICWILAVTVLLALPGRGVHAEVRFERIEFELKQPAECWMAEDIDRDGDLDLVLIHRDSRLLHHAVVIRQHPTGRFAYSERQDIPLNTTGGVYDLGDVAGGSSLELVQLTNGGVRYYTIEGARFDTTSHLLIDPESAPDLPPIAEPVHWHCIWPGSEAEKETVVLPHLSHLELWRAGTNGEYARAGTIPCPMTGQAVSQGDGLRMALPELRAQSVPSATEFFFESAGRWHGVRRATPNDTEFTTSLMFNESPSSIGQVLGISSDFRAGCLMDDLNSDGAPDVARWTNHGGINSASCEIDVYFGPFNGRLPDEPHARVSIKGVYGFPRFGDLNGDGRKDMLVCAMETGSLSTAKMFVMKKLSLHLLAYHQRADNSFSIVADHRRSADYRLNLDVADPVMGPILQFTGDLDADGFEDFVVQTGSDHLDVYRGHAENMIDKDSPERLDCPPARDIALLDVDGDGRLDLLLQHHGSDNAGAVTILLSR